MRDATRWRAFLAKSLAHGSALAGAALMALSCATASGPQTGPSKLVAEVRGEAPIDGLYR